MHTNNSTVQLLVNSKLLLYPHSVLSENYTYQMSKWPWCSASSVVIMVSKWPWLEYESHTCIIYNLSLPMNEDEWYVCNNVRVLCQLRDTLYSCLVLLVVSLHQYDPLFDTVLRCIIVYYMIIKRVCLLQQCALEEMVHRLICFFSLARGIIIFFIFPLFHVVFTEAHLCIKSIEAFHSIQVSDAPLVKDSLSLYISVWCTDCRWLDHSSIRWVDKLSISSSVSRKMLLLFFRRIFVIVWQCNGCLISFSCTHSLSVCSNTSTYSRESNTG